MAILKIVNRRNGKRKRSHLAGVIKYVLKTEKTEEKLIYRLCIFGKYRAGGCGKNSRKNNGDGQQQHDTDDRRYRIFFHSMLTFALITR